MDLKKKFWVFTVGSLLLLIFLILGTVFLFHSQVSPEVWQILAQVAGEHFSLLFFSIFLVILLSLIFAGDIFLNYILPLYHLTEETALISTVNPGHRVRVRGCREILRLGKSINEAAERLQDMQSSVGEQLQQVTAELEKEKQILGAVIGELPEGVVVCNLKGDILLYNQKAREFFPSSKVDSNSTIPCGYLGLGRSIYSLLDGYLLDHSLHDLEKRLQEINRPAVYNFMAKGAAEQLFKISMVTIRGEDDSISGYVLLISDLSLQMKIEQKTQDLLNRFLERTRENVAGICASIDDLIKNRDISEREMKKNKNLICENVQILNGDLEEALSELPVAFKSQWPMQSIDIEKVFQILKQEARRQTSITIHLTGSMQKMLLRVELYTFIRGLLFLLHLLEYEHAVRDLTCVAALVEETIDIDLLWRGDPVGENILDAWKKKTFLDREQEGVLNVQDVLARHEAEIFSAQGYGGNSYLRLKLPSVDAVKRIDRTFPEEVRVPQYDFGIFTRPSRSSEEGDTSLKEVVYTVFDLETTGLDPANHDEIVSISAVRVVNNRIISEESFDQLVNPRRPVPYDAVRIHGISEDMLRDKPGIDEVLPLFAKFCEETVLVAHSADFDLAFLKKREKSSGISLSNQVLDTFKLSVLVHPSQKDHSLEALAARLGVRINNRHSSLGDALATAEIFLRLIPLLSRRGIRSLKQAL
ncbi:MAG: hypothetical protein K9K64_02670 [Desulfohalobiaceae bacterium]|nr:hypothetical protein [Desulfohalobiaceae bacterium]